MPPWWMSSHRQTTGDPKGNRAASAPAQRHGAGAAVTGGQRQAVTATPEHPPVFVRDHTLLPLSEPVVVLDSNTVFNVHLAAYGGNSRPCELREDDGATFDYETGRWATIAVHPDGSFDRPDHRQPRRYRIVGRAEPPAGLLNALLTPAPLLVWAVDPTKDSLEEAVSYFCKFAHDCLRLAGIRCRLDVPESSPRISISSSERHNLFLALKETLTNVVRHAQASEVWVQIKHDQKAFEVSIEDNGRGFEGGGQGQSRETGTGTGGHGIENMRQRMARIGATLDLRCDPAKGTRIRLILPLAGQCHPVNLHSPMASTERKTITVAVVEDDPEVWQSLTDIQKRSKWLRRTSECLALFVPG